MKITKELKGLPEDELSFRLEEFKKELLKLNVEVSTGANLSSPGMLKRTKKNIARILTLLREKEVKDK